MLILYIIIYFIFYILYYIIQGIKDGNIIMWQQSTLNPDLMETKKLMSNIYSKRWYEQDVYEKMLVHVFLTLPIFLINSGILLFISLLLLSISIRLLLYNYFINICMKVDINHINAKNWIDSIMIRFENNGISQWKVKFGLLLLSIVLVIVFLLI